MPKMLADVVYTSSHSPLMHGALKLCGFGFNTSNALASASIASLSSSDAVLSTGAVARVERIARIAFGVRGRRARGAECGARHVFESRLARTSTW